MSSEPRADELPARGYRTYEVYQRERVGETTNLISPRDLISAEYLADPFGPVAILRENYPCYRDWLSNRFWITRYDDVTSVFTDDANFETRPRRWFYGAPLVGEPLASEAVREALTASTDDTLASVLEAVLDDLASGEHPVDLAVAFAARLPIELLGRSLGVEPPDLGRFADVIWRVVRGAGWSEVARMDGLQAYDELVQLLAELLDSDRAAPLLDVVRESGAHSADLAATLLELDHETLHGSLANLWFLLLTHHEQLDRVKAEPRVLKFAYLESLRHSPPLLATARFARHEVERFGRLLPDGAMLYLSAAAANRDPRQFADPDRFMVDRKDLCQREPRGQFRADGLPAGVSFGSGPPSKLPAVPKEAPRSSYALTRDVAVAASQALLERFPSISLAEGATPMLRSRRLGEMYTCWSLPVVL